MRVSAYALMHHGNVGFRFLQCLAPMRSSTPLYEARFEHDACGVGFIAARDRQPRFG